MLRELRAVFDANPHLWRRTADLQELVVGELIDQAADGNQFVAEALARRVKEMKRELAGPRPTPLLALAVDRVVTCWLHLEKLELVSPDPKADRTPRDTWWLARHREADLRFQAALRMLSTLQRLRPAHLEPATRTVPFPAVRNRPDSREPNP